MGEHAHTPPRGWSGSPSRLAYLAWTLMVVTLWLWFLSTGFIADVWDESVLVVKFSCPPSPT